MFLFYFIFYTNSSAIERHTNHSLTNNKEEFKRKLTNSLSLYDVQVQFPFKLVTVTGQDANTKKKRIITNSNNHTLIRRGGSIEQAAPSDRFESNGQLKSTPLHCSATKIEI